MWAQLAGEAQRRQTIELRKGEIRQNDIRREAFQLASESFGVFHAARCQLDAGPLELAQLELGIHVRIFEQQYFELSDHVRLDRAQRADGTWFMMTQ
jgi:hypothetical protein